MVQSAQKHGKLLGSIFTTYLIVLIIPIALAFLCYQESLRVVQQDIEFENRAMLEQAVEVMDERVEELNNIGLQLISSTQVQNLRYINKPFDYPNTSKLISARQTMSKYATFNDLLFDYMLYFNNGGFVLNDQAVYSYEDFYLLYMHEPNQSYDDWLAKHLNASPSYGSSAAVTVDYIRNNINTPESLDLVVFTYSFFPYDYVDGYAALYVKQDMLLDMIHSESGSVLIQNAQGNLIASRVAEEYSIGSLQSAVSEMSGAYTSEQRKIDGKSLFLTQITSKKTGLCVAIATSSDVVFARLASLRSIIWWSLFAALVLGTLLCYTLSRRNVNFIRNIVKGSGEELLGMTYSKAFKSLRVSFSDIQMANDAMSRTLESQKPYLLHIFLSLLIDGGFRSEEEAVVMAKTVGVLPAPRPRCAVLFRFISGDAPGGTLSLQFAVSCKAVIRVAMEALEPQAYSLDKSEDGYVVLLEGDNLKERVDALIALVRSKLPDSINEMLFIYVGNTVEKLTDVVRSYTNAATLIYLQPSPEETPALYFDETESTKYALFYPQDVQHHLADCTLSGDENGMIEILNDLKERNSATAGIPCFMRQLFVSSLLNTLLQITTMSGLPANETALIRERIMELMGTPLNVQLAQVDQLFLMLCHAMQQSKNGRQQSLIDNVKAYLNANYADCDLSLASVASHFDVSESYLSYTFKLQNGVNFFSYVENIRISKAKELLKTTSLKVSDIAEKVGYTSSNSFCRAFKRSTGDNASSYRNGLDI